VASWNSSTQRWRRLGTIASNGLDGSCNAMVLDSSNNRLYVGGNFKKANDTLNTDLSVNCVAYWDITNSLWKTLGGTTRTTNGLDGSCNALAFDSSNNRLYVGGNFRKYDGFAAMAGLHLNKKFQVSYSYDLNRGKFLLSTMNRGTHELVLGFLIGNRHAEF
jgi:hypothetical protein